MYMQKSMFYMRKYMYEIHILYAKIHVCTCRNPCFIRVNTRMKSIFYMLKSMYVHAETHV